MERKKLFRTASGVLSVLLAFFLLLQLLTALLSPKYAQTLVEGGMLSQYYRESGGHDVIFLGDCEVYANITPMELYRQDGITAYVRGSSQQMLWQSYYVLKETFRYETPRAVVLNVNAMRYGEPVSEAYNRLTMDKMRWSPEKLGIIRASMTEEETFLGYVFPILRYHSRITQLTEEDFRYLFRAKDNTWNGHLVNQGVKPAGTLPARRPLASCDFPEICWTYLEKIRLLCRDQGTELILIKAPSLYPFWYPEYDGAIRDYARDRGLAYYNLLEAAEDMGIDYETDTFDGGLHLNLSGATKLSRYLSRLLKENHGLEDHRQDPAIAGLYDEKLRLYDQAILESKENKP